ncbi:hypothetical protein J4457_03305 [Candidatus Woesearchaeota archaeon]|nr:hypothetical protein [Candidatus Woesearchaeota archaeon]
MRKIIDDFKAAWHSFKNKKTILVIILDFIFFVVALLIAEYYLTTIYENVSSILDVMQANMNIEQELTKAALGKLAAMQQAMQVHYTSIFQNLGYMALYLFLLYLLLQGCAWYLSSRRVHPQSRFLPFMAKFSILALLQTIILLAILFFSTNLPSISTGNVVIVGKDSFLAVTKYLLALILIVFDYWSVMSYGFLVNKSWIKDILVKPWKNFVHLFSRYLVFSVLSIAAFSIFYLLIEKNMLIASIFGLTILLPSFAFFRLLIYHVTSEKHDH